MEQVKEKLHVYLAGPIFTERDRNFNKYLEQEILKLCPDLDLYLAQDNASINNKTGCATSADIYVGDVTRLQEADILITIMSGDLPPIGSSYETAYFCGLCETNKKKRIIALYDDNRDAYYTYSEAKKDAMISSIAENQFPYINLLAVGFVKKWGNIYHTSQELIQAVKREYDIGNDNVISGIYKITNLKSNKVYIGKSKDIYRHWLSYYNIDKKINKDLKSDIEKLGLNYFRIEIIEKCDINDLDKREKYWIKYYEADITGYNSTEGGSGCKKNKITNIPVYKYDLDGNFIQEYYSLEEACRDVDSSTRDKIRKSAMCEDSHLKCANFLWRYYKVDKIPPYKYIGRGKEIYAYDKNTREFLKAYQNAVYAGKELSPNSNNASTHIRTCADGGEYGRYSAYGYLWAYQYFDRLPVDYYQNKEKYMREYKYE